MIPLIWAGIATVVGFFVFIVEALLGLHDQNVSHANVILWLVVPPIAVVGAMVHARRSASGAVGYGATLLRGLKTTLITCLMLLVLWILVTTVLVPDYYKIMVDYAYTEAVNRGLSGDRLNAEIAASSVIFQAPAFYLVTVFVSILSGSVAALVAAIGLRKRKETL